MKQEVEFKIDGLDIVGPNTRISFPSYENEASKSNRNIQMASICAFLNGEKTNSELSKDGLLTNILRQIDNCIDNPSNVDWPALLINWKTRIERSLH